MPDGPPFITYATTFTEHAMPVAAATNYGVRVELDENRHWRIEFRFGSNGPVVEQEFIILKKDGDLGGPKWSRELNCREPGPEPKVVDNFKFDNEDLFFVMQYKPGNWAGGSPTGGIALDPSPERRWVSIDFVTAVGSGSVKVTML